MNTVSINDVFEDLGLVLLFINAVLYNYSYVKGNKTKAIKYFVIYLISTFFVLSSSILLVYIQGKMGLAKDNLFLSHFYFILQFVFLSLFYREFFTKRQTKYLYIISVFVIIVLIVQYLLKPNLFYKFNLLEILITSFPLIVYSVIHLYNSLTKPSKFIYINSGVLIYLSASTLIFILGDYLSAFRRNESIKNIWLINKILYVIYLILILLEWKKSIKLAKSK